MKTCTKCNVEKPLSAYHNSSQGDERKRSQCKECIRADALVFAKITNKLRCYVGSEYIKRTHPFYVAGKRFKDWDDCYAYWTKKSGVNFSHLIGNEETVSGEGYVYIIYNPAWDGWYKIGKANDLEKRLRNYQTGDPHRAYKICYEMKFDDCMAAENAVKDLSQNDDKLIRKNEWIMGSFDRIRNIINEVKREEVSSGHRDELNCQFDLVLRN